DGLRELPSAARAQPDPDPTLDPFRDSFSVAPSPGSAPAAFAHSPAPTSPSPALVAVPNSCHVLSDSAPPTSSNPRPRRRAVYGSPNPTPEMVLSELARVGLYEQDSTVVPAWEAAPRPTTRRLWVTAGALLLSAGLGVGGY